MKLKQIDNSPDAIKQMAALGEKIPSPGWLKPTLITMSVLCLLSVVIGTLLIALNMDAADISVENTRYNYILLFFLPVPMAALAFSIFAFVKNYELNVTIPCTVSVSVLCVMLILGLSTFFIGNLYKHDYAYVNEIEEIIDIDLPDNGTISTQYLNEDDTEYGISIIKYSGIKFTDMEEAESFKKYVLSEPSIWRVPYVNPDREIYVDSVLPTLLDIPNSENSKFLFFNVRDGLLNTLPEVEGPCDLIVIAYDGDSHTMRIWEISYYVFSYELPGGELPE